MIRFEVKAAARQLGCECRGAMSKFAGISIDSRKLQAGQLFVALPGENVDGHQYVLAAQALGKGNIGILISHVMPNALVATLTFVPFLLRYRLYFFEQLH